MKKIILGTSLFLMLSAFSANALDLTLDELKSYNGVDKPEIYVAIEGTIYDVTNSPQWNGKRPQKEGHKKPQVGVHHNGATAGRDLTKEIDTKSPHGRKVLAKLPVVGKIITK